MYQCVVWDSNAPGYATIHLNPCAPTQNLNITQKHYTTNLTSAQGLQEESHIWNARDTPAIPNCVYLARLRPSLGQRATYG